MSSLLMSLAHFVHEFFISTFVIFIVKENVALRMASIKFLIFLTGFFISLTHGIPLAIGKYIVARNTSIQNLSCNIQNVFTSFIKVFIKIYLSVLIESLIKGNGNSSQPDPAILLNELEKGLGTLLRSGEDKNAETTLHTEQVIEQIRPIDIVKDVEMLDTIEIGGIVNIDPVTEKIEVEQKAEIQLTTQPIKVSVESSFAVDSNVMRFDSDGNSLEELKEPSKKKPSNKKLPTLSSEASASSEGVANNMLNDHVINNQLKSIAKSKKPRDSSANDSDENEDDFFQNDDIPLITIPLSKLDYTLYTIFFSQSN
jgi:hypothetical protein